MSERWRLKAGVEVEVDIVWLRTGSGAVIAFKVPRKYGGADLITEPIPEEPAGPKVGDEVTAEWLDSEWSRGRYHVVRNPDGSAGAWAASVPGANAVRHDGTEEQTWPLLALHPVERWEEPRDERGVADLTGYRPQDNIELIKKLRLQPIHEQPAQETDSTEPPLDVRMDRAERRIEALEAQTANILADMPWLNPNPKEVMPDARDRDGSGTPDVAPPPGAEQDAPGGECACLEFWSAHHPECPTQQRDDESSVEDVLEWLEDIESAWAASVTDAKMPRAAAHIIREQKKKLEGYEGMRKYYRKHYTATTNPVDVREVLWCLESISAVYPIAADAGRIIRERGEEIEEWASLYRRTRDDLRMRHSEVRELRADVTRLADAKFDLTERLTITPEKMKAAFAEQGKHHFRDHPAMLCILTAAGMIDPEVKS